MPFSVVLSLCHPERSRGIPDLFPLPRARGTSLTGELCITGCWCWSYTRWHPLFLCHSERSEETRIFLGAKHFDFTEGMRSRAAHMQLRTALYQGEAAPPARVRVRIPRCPSPSLFLCVIPSAPRDPGSGSGFLFLNCAPSFLFPRPSQDVAFRAAGPLSAGEAAPSARVRVQLFTGEAAERSEVGEGAGQ
jgi:hypothetical protein